jgi:hypothetical protein
MRFSAGIVSFGIAVTSGCNALVQIVGPAIPGSGVAKEETRAVDAFHAVDAGNALQVTVTITQGAKPTLKISGDDNLVPLIESVVRDGSLILKVKDNSNISPKVPLLAEVVTSALDRVEASGAANVKVKGGAKADRFTADASGAAHVTVEALETSNAVASASGAARLVLSGSAASLKVNASGASDVKAEALAVEDADVSISGASGAALKAKNSVNGDVSGASRLELYGRPAKNTVSTSGASHVTEKPLAVEKS